MKNCKIILVTGLKGSGKDTIGTWLGEKYYYQPMSFAGTLKDMVAKMFNWDREALDGITLKSRVWRETVDKEWSELLGRDITPRLMLQEIGTDVVRKGFVDNFWILSAISKLKEGRKYVFTDVRFPNEIIMLKERFSDVIVINVVRPPLPEWYGRPELAEKLGIHESECTMMNYGNLVDYTIINDKGIEDLCYAVDEIMEVNNA